MKCSNLPIDVIISKLGYDNSNNFIKFSELNESPLPSHSKKIISEIRPYATYIVDNRPFILFFDAVIQDEDTFKVKCEGHLYEGKSVIIATGSKHRELKLEKEKELTGHGISYCAVCDGPFYANKDVSIIGGGNSAMQEAILLSSYCKSVTMIQNLPCFTGEKALADKIAKTDNIKVIFNKLVVALNGDQSLESIILKDQTTGLLDQFNIESVFVAIGQEPNNSMFKNLCSLDEQGFIVTDDMCCANVEGVYVAGDCRQKRIRQIVTASSDGSIAALQAIKYLDSKGQ